MLRGKVSDAVTKEAATAKVDLVLDSSALNGYGLPIVSGKSKDLTDAVIARLEAGSKEAAAKAAPPAPAK